MQVAPRILHNLKSFARRNEKVYQITKVERLSAGYKKHLQAVISAEVGLNKY